MDKDFAVSVEHLKRVKDQPDKVFYHNQLIEYLSDINMNGNILDIGERNPGTERVEEAFDQTIDSTNGDLDVGFEIYADECFYNVVIFNHVIEHLFNPLFCLQNIKKVMAPGAVMVIGTPIKPSFLTWDKGHFHEMDEYMFRKLIDRAGLKIIRWEKYYHYKPFTYKSLTGIRPFLRLLYKRHSWITVIGK